METTRRLLRGKISNQCETTEKGRTNKKEWHTYYWYYRGYITRDL